MTKMTIRIALSAIFFSAILLTLACPDPQTTNQNANRSNSATNSNSDALVAADCSGGNMADKIKKVKDGVKRNIDNDGKLKLQHDAGWFTYVVAEDPVSHQMVMTFSGRIGGENEMKDLVATTNGYMKKGCVDRVTFGAMQGPLVAEGFEWSACDYPTRPCPNGECREVCPMIVGNSNSNTNSGNKNAN
jgi:hypothetical protein